MPFTYDMTFPTEEELTVPEINLSTAALLAGALHLGKVCEFENNEFMLCKSELEDPRKCIKEGKEVTSCALKFFQQLKKKCRHEFEDFAGCLRKSSRNWSYGACRNTHEIFNKCVLDKLGVEKPPVGWNSEIHVHKTEREKPVVEEPVYPEAPAPFIPSKDVKPPKYGARPWV